MVGVFDCCGHGKADSRPLPVPQSRLSSRARMKSQRLGQMLSHPPVISLVCLGIGPSHFTNATLEVFSPHFQGFAILTSTDGANDAAAPKTHCR